MIKLGKIGIWTGQLDSQPAARAREAVAELEALGYGAVWFPESRGQESFSHAALLLGATGRLVVATGITKQDLAGAGSDRLVDDLVAWGDVEAIVARVRAHLGAGADHVCVQVLLGALPHQRVPHGAIPGPPPRGVPPIPLPQREWRELAPALLALASDGGATSARRR